jgi:hypothetical protein
VVSRLARKGISWLATLPTWTPHDIRDYAGHSELSTTDIYVRRSRKAMDRIKPFPALPGALFGSQLITLSLDRFSA